MTDKEWKIITEHGISVIEPDTEPGKRVCKKCKGHKFIIGGESFSTMNCPVCVTGYVLHKRYRVEPKTDYEVALLWSYLIQAGYEDKTRGIENFYAHRNPYRHIIVDMIHKYFESDSADTYADGEESLLFIVTQA